MRKRNEIERDFNVAMGSRKEEFLEYQREKILLEVMLKSEFIHLVLLLLIVSFKRKLI